MPGSRGTPLFFGHSRDRVTPGDTVVRRIPASSRQEPRRPGSQLRPPVWWACCRSPWPTRCARARGNSNGRAGNPGQSRPRGVAPECRINRRIDRDIREVIALHFGVVAVFLGLPSDRIELHARRSTSICSPGLRESPVRASLPLDWGHPTMNRMRPHEFLTTALAAGSRYRCSPGVSRAITSCIFETSAAIENGLPMNCAELSITPCLSITSAV